MGAYETEWLRHLQSRSPGETRFRRLAAATALLFCCYLAATVAGAPRETSSLIFSIVVAPLPFK